MGYVEKKSGFLFVIYVWIKKDICNVVEWILGDFEVFWVLFCEVVLKVFKNGYRFIYLMIGFLS